MTTAMADSHTPLGAASTFSCLTDFEAHLKSYQKNTNIKFVVSKSHKSFGKHEVSLTGTGVHWQLKTVPFDGTPFAVLGTKTYVCHQGRDKHAAEKRKRQEKMAKTVKEEDVFVETMRKSKKAGCPAAIYAVHICRFPDYKISEDTPYQRREQSTAVRKALKENPSPVVTEQMFTAYFPHVTVHKNHPIVGKAAGSREVLQGSESSSPTRRRLYPLDKDIRNIMQKVNTGSMKSSADQLNLQDLVETWKEEGCAIEYRPSQETDDGAVEKLLLCLQTQWQRRLLVLYGQQLCLLDATYRTSRYSVPVFFLCVRTNVNYIVVGVFVTQSEKKEDIREALEVFKKWNADWKPSHFMVNFCNTEIGALEEVFKDSNVILCDFHREKAWIEWTRKKGHGVTCKEEVLKMLGAIADSGTAEEFDSSTCLLKQHSAWQTNESLRRWFSTKWLSQAERWVMAFKKEDLRVAAYANNGVERQNETFRHSYLKVYKDRSLSDTTTVIVKDILPRSYQRYIELNVRGHRVNSQYLPLFLRDKPIMVAEHIMSRHQESLMFTLDHVASAGEASFKVNIQRDTTVPQCSVFFGSESQMPSCTCKDWQENLLPCTHFCAVFNLVPEWSWDRLCLAYRENPLFVIDEVCLKHSADGSGTSAPSSTATNPSASEQQTHAESSSSSTCARKRQKCDSLLKDLADKVSHLQDESYMDRVIEKLEDLLEDVIHHTPHDGPLALLSTPAVKRRRSETAEPLRLLKKHMR
ncbi:uncharacterized protein LOC141775412 [Sebastes fasciatus]|uniref:uncharacterized protein LOC141775412 n=1 Tax=Sebastes fasciatus TaxID=394691 RepID=UPI003D9FAB6F